MKIYRKFVKDNLIVALGQTLSFSKGIILLPILVKNLGASLYGSYALLMLGIGFVSGISTAGIGFKLKRYMPAAKTANKRRELFYPQFIFKLVSMLVASVLLIITSDFIKTTIFKNQGDFSINIIAAILIVYVFYNVAMDYFRYSQRLHYFTIADVTQSYVFICFISISIFMFNIRSLNAILISCLLTLIIVAMPLLIKIKQEIGIKFSGLHFKNIAEDIRLGFPLALSYVIDFVLSGSDRYVIAVFMLPTDVGYYSSAYTLGSVIILFPKILGVVLPPLLSQATDAGNDHEVKNLLNYSLKFFFIITIPFVVGSCIVGKPLLEIFTNQEIAQAGYVLIPIIAAGIIFYGLNMILTKILFVNLKTKSILGVNLLSAALNLVLNIIFIYIFRNILVAAVTTLISYLVSFIVLNFKIKEYLRVHYDFNLIFKCLGSSLIMAMFLYYYIIFIGPAILSIFTGIVLSGAVYFLALCILRAFDDKEIKFIKKLFV